jgi:hypothetical protein
MGADPFNPNLSKMSCRIFVTGKLAVLLRFEQFGISE